GERRLPEPGRAVEQDMVERVAALARRLDVDAKLLLELRLPDELVEAARAQLTVVGAVFRSDPSANDTIDHARSLPVRRNGSPSVPTAPRTRAGWVQSSRDARF